MARVLRPVLAFVSAIGVVANEESCTVTADEMGAAKQAVLGLSMQLQVAGQVRVLFDLGIQDMLDPKEPKDITDLAKQAKTQPRKLYRVLRSLSNHGWVKETADGKFLATALSQGLRTSAGNEQGAIGMSKLMLAREHFEMYGHLADFIKTESPHDNAFTALYGSEYKHAFDYISKTPKYGDGLNSGMAAFSRIEAEWIAKNADIADRSHVIDVAGGMGVFLRTVLPYTKAKTGKVMEMASVIAQGKAEGYDADGVVEFVEGDIFKQVAKGGDLYLLKRILHDWNDEQSVQILKAIHDAANPGAKLIVAEYMVKQPGENDFAKDFDVLMMLWGPGGEHTKEEHEVRLKAAGWNLQRVVYGEPDSSFMGFLEATKA